MKKRTLALIIFLVAMASSTITSAIFLSHILPGMTAYMSNDPQYIKLEGNAERVRYYKVLDQAYLGRLYLHHPLYFFKRQEGKKLLVSLAARGYTPAANDISAYYLKHGGYTEPLQFTRGFRWATIAAQQGDFRELYSLLSIFNMHEFVDVDEQTMILEDLAGNSQFPWAAEYLKKYYTEQDNTEKAKYWAQKAEEISNSPFEEPACTTITPWRGY